jgi:hypothetical protein
VVKGFLAIIMPLASLGYITSGFVKLAPKLSSGLLKAALMLDFLATHG